MIAQSKPLVQCFKQEHPGLARDMGRVTGNIVSTIASKRILSKAIQLRRHMHTIGHFLLQLHIDSSYTTTEQYVTQTRVMCS